MLPNQDLNPFNFFVHLSEGMNFSSFTTRRMRMFMVFLGRFWLVTRSRWIRKFWWLLPFRPICRRYHLHQCIQFSCIFLIFLYLLHDRVYYFQYRTVIYIKLLNFYLISPLDFLILLSYLVNLLLQSICCHLRFKETRLLKQQKHIGHIFPTEILVRNI